MRLASETRSAGVLRGVSSLRSEAALRSKRLLVLDGLLRGIVGLLSHLGLTCALGSDGRNSRLVDGSVEVKFPNRGRPDTRIALLLRHDSNDEEEIGVEEQGKPINECESL